MIGCHDSLRSPHLSLVDFHELLHERQQGSGRNSLRKKFLTLNTGGKFSSDLPAIVRVHANKLCRLISGSTFFSFRQICLKLKLFRVWKFVPTLKVVHP